MDQSIIDLQEKIPEINLVFFIQCDGNSIDGIKNRKLFRNYLSRFSIECRRIDVQVGRPVILDLNYDENKIKTKIHEHLAKLSFDDTPKLERLHIFYFGRYWRKLENILDLPLVDNIADQVHLTSMEMRKYDEISESDMLNFYSGNEHHSISLNDSIDEFYELAIQTNQQHILLQHKKMDFIKFGSFLAMRNPKSNEALNIVNEIVHSHISSVDLGFVMGNRKIEISEEALDELESQTGLVLNREIRYFLYDCYMKTSVARYQKLRNGARSKFYSKSVRSQDSGIVEDGTEDDAYKIYQNPDFERQEKYAIIENIIKNPEVYDTNLKTYLVHDVLNGSSTNNENQELKGTKPTVAINESNNELIEVSNENDSHYLRCQTLPMDRYGSVIGSYYHGHPYIGYIFDDSSNEENVDSSDHQEMTRQCNSENLSSESSTNKNGGQLGISKAMNNLRQRFNGSEPSVDTYIEYETPYQMCNSQNSISNVLTKRFKGLRKRFKGSEKSLDTSHEYGTYAEENYDYFDIYETGGSNSQTRLMKCSTAVNRFFNRTRFLRNLKMFWQQILCSIFFILGKDFDFENIVFVLNYHKLIITK